MPNVRDFMMQCERGLSRAWEAERLVGRVQRTWQGPRVITVAITPDHPTAAAIGRILRMGPAIESYLGTAPVRVYLRGGNVQVDIPSPFRIELTAASLLGRGLAAPIGVTGERDQRTGKLIVAGVDFERPATPHLLAVGPTGGGKTTAIQGVVYHLARQMPLGRLALYVILDPAKALRWQSVRMLGHTRATVIDTRATVELLTWVVKDLIPAHGRGRANLVIVDDLLYLLKQDSGIGPLLAAIASQGRESHVHLIVGTQRLGKEGAGSAAVDGNIHTRLVFKTPTKLDSYLFTGIEDAGADKLTEVGDALLVREGQAVRVMIPMVSSEEWSGLLNQPGKTTAGYTHEAPWQGRVTAVTGGDRVSTAGTGEGETLSDPGTGDRLQPGPPDAAARNHIRRVYARLGSKNATCFAVYGGKNGRYMGWIDSALSESGGM